MTTTNPELDSLDPQTEGPLTLVDGLEVDVNRLRTRELLSLLRILTHGAGPALADITFDGATSEFATRLISIALIAIPEAEDETITFVQRMTTPHGLIPGRRLSKPEQEINQGLQDSFAEAMENPEIEDLFAIVERVIRTEAPHVQALGKKFAFLLETATGTQNSNSPQTTNESSDSSSEN